AENTNKVSFVALGHSTAVHDRGNATESRADASPPQLQNHRLMDPT
ncbi:unnamed protein product, partial [Ectocarpus sp. 12 AP-2014]